MNIHYRAIKVIIKSLYAARSNICLIRTIKIYNISTLNSIDVAVGRTLLYNQIVFVFVHINIVNNILSRDGKTK